MTSYIYTPGCERISSQPQPAPTLDYTSTSFDFEAEKTLHEDYQCSSGGKNSHGHDCDQFQCSSHTHSNHRGCHNTRLRRFFFPIIAAFIVIGGILALGCVHAGGYDLSNLGLDLQELVGRAVNDGSTTNNNTFVHNKLYLIVIFVGLLLVIIMAICLSAWCCRGAFENPLCCPCYLCACCGGLACLECIGCGLCAEGMDQM